MANLFRSTADIAQDMCNDFKAITGVTLKPTQTDDSNVIKFLTDAAAISSFTALLQKVANNIFPQTADTQSLIQHLATRSLPTQLQPSKSHGQIQFTATGAGVSISLGVQVKRVSDGALFQTIQAGVTGSSGILNLFCESLGNGQSLNLDSLNQPFVITQPLPGVQAACTNVTLFLDGRDLETDAQMLARIIIHDQDTNSGGNAVAYETWARAASTEVVTAKCLPLVRGADTVDVIITSGTSDIAAAVLSGQSVTRLPSVPLIQTVQNYINTLNPVTDNVLVKAPTEVPFNVTFRYKLLSENTAARAYYDGVITNIIKIYVYQALPGQVLSPTDITRLVDQQIGDQLKERSCDNFNGSVTYIVVPSASIFTPGLITLVPIA